MSFSQFNIDIFRAINDLGKQYSFLNPAIVFLAEYMVYILALIILTYWFIGSRKSRMMVLQAMVAFVFSFFQFVFRFGLFVKKLDGYGLYLRFV